MSHDKKDYYKELGVDKNATEADIKQAFRKLARQYHPDANKDNKDAQAKFQKIAEAYSILGDAEKRAKYDKYGIDSDHEHPNPFGQGFGGFSGANFEDFFGSDAGNIFDEFFGGGRSNNRSTTQTSKGRDSFNRTTITLKDVVFGKNLDLNINKSSTCSHCHGSGANSNADIETCKTCNGQGRVIQQNRTPFGIIQSERVCHACHGHGKKIKVACHVCHGKTYTQEKIHKTINIPAGTVSGSQLVLRGFGEPGNNGGPPGDFYIEVIVETHKYFKREDMNLILEVPISVADALVGGVISVPTFEGPVKIEIPAGTKHGEYLKIRHKGIHGSVRKGDLLIKLLVEIPSSKDISKKEKEAFQELQSRISKKINTEFLNKVNHTI